MSHLPTACFGSGTRRAVLSAAALVAAPACAVAQSGPAPSAPPAGELFVVTYRPGPSWRQGAPMSEQGLEPHGAYHRRLVEEGRAYAGGGFVGADGGMAILRAADLAEAEAILAADPAIVAGIFAAELRHWRPRFYSNGPLVAQAE